MLKLFNTLTRKIESFVPINPPYVGYYSCGPTVYDFAHIGHARTYIFADILERVLQFNNYKTIRVMNITDVGHLTSDSDMGEDKMEKGAKRENKSVWEIAEFYTQDFYKMLDDLNIKKPKIITKASEYIPQMIKLIRKLEDKGFTYITTDGVYFNTKLLHDYGKLTGNTFAELEKSLKAGARVEVVADKKNLTDFALWKFSYSDGRSFDSAQDDVLKRRQMEWDSPWGCGFPGWHIECSAMGMDRLGECFDIHTGGVDHIPVHHTNEIAQSEAATGKPFVRYWLHAGHLTIGGEKMSKSLGNYFRVSDLTKKGFNPLSLRYLFLQASYRKDMNFTWESIEAAENSFKEMVNKISEIKASSRSGERSLLTPEKLKKVDYFRNEFIDHINNDLNTATALAVFWSAVKSNIPPGDKLDLIYYFDEVLGLRLREVTDGETVEIPERIFKLSQLREEARKKKDFNEADKYRREIEKEGFIIEDTQEGPKIKSS